MTNKALRSRPSDEQRAFVGYGSFEEAIDALEIALAPGPYICGDQFTAADLYVGVADRLRHDVRLDREAAGLRGYFGRLQARPAAIRAREIDDALVAEQQARTPT